MDTNDKPFSDCYRFHLFVFGQNNVVCFICLICSFVLVKSFVGMCDRYAAVWWERLKLCMYHLNGWNFFHFISGKLREEKKNTKLINKEFEGGDLKYVSLPYPIVSIDISINTKCLSFPFRQQFLFWQKKKTEVKSSNWPMNDEEKKATYIVQFYIGWFPVAGSSSEILLFVLNDF